MIFAFFDLIIFSVIIHFLCLNNNGIIRGWRFGTSKMHLNIPIVKAVVRSKVAVLFLLIHC